MKPSSLLPLAIICVAIGAAWIFTLLYNMEWWVRHTSSGFVMAIIIIAAFSITFSGLIMLASCFE